MEQLPKVSIIVPVYNVAPYLRQCMDSIINQTYRNIEIICIDDGSTDKSGEILDEYAATDDRVHVVHQENRGLSAARNAGFLRAAGTYVMYLDSDDWINWDTCAIAVDLATKYNAELVFWPYIRAYENKELPKTLFDDELILFDKDTFHQLVYKTIVGLHDSFLRHPEHADTLVTAWGKLYRKEMLDCCKAEFVSTKEIGTEDVLYNVEALKAVFSAVYVQKYLNHYRKTNSGSLTKTYRPQLRLQWKELFCRMRKSILADKQSDDIISALNNRISLSIIGLGLNALALPNQEALTEIRNVLSDQEYRAAIKTLPMRYFPPHWWVFFACCKLNFSAGVFLLLKCIERMKG